MRTRLAIAFLLASVATFGRGFQAIALEPAVGRASALVLASDLNPLNLVPLTVAPTPEEVRLPAGGGSDTKSVASLAAPPPPDAPALTATLLEGHVEGGGAPEGPVSARASVAALSIPSLALNLSALESQCTILSGVAGGTSNIVGTIGGAPVVPGTQPNTVIPVPGVATVVLNEQQFSNEGGVLKMTVTALRIIGEAPGSGDLIVARSHCDPAAPEPPPDVAEISHPVLLLAPLVGFAGVKGLRARRRRRLSV